MHTHEHSQGRISNLDLKSCGTVRQRLHRLTATGAPLTAPAADVDLPPEIERLAENVVGYYRRPVGVAEHFIVNGRETLIAMATQEPTVVAAASSAAKSCRHFKGFRVTASRSNVSVCQIVYPPLGAVRTLTVTAKLTPALDDLRRQMIRHDPMLRHGGGVCGLRFEVLGGGSDSMIVVLLSVDTAQAMGANVVTRMGETLAGLMEPIIGERPLMSIVTNCFQGVRIEAAALWPAKKLGPAVAERIMLAQRFAELDDMRAATHNKGVKNGVFAVAYATGQDVEAIAEALGATASVRATGKPIGPLTTYRLSNGLLRGELRMHVPLGIVGGATGHPDAVWNRAMMGATSVRRLAEVIGAVGLASNFAALRCLVTEGIPAAHRRVSQNRRVSR